MNKPVGNPIEKAAAQNAQLRALLLASAPRNSKKLPAQTAPVGGTTRIKLFNVGILTKLMLEIQADLTIGTAVATPSSKAPYNLIRRLRITDYEGTDRVNLSGYDLWKLNSVRKRRPYGLNNSAGAAVFTNPDVPTAVANGSVKFNIEVPIAFDPDNPVMQLQDLRGAMMAQTNNGEAWLTIDWISTLYANGDVDALYSGAATTTVVGQNASPITVTAWQHYLLPQAIGGKGFVPLPMVDLLTVYELNGALISSDNIVNGAERLINFPNNRSVVGLYFNFVNNKAMSNATDNIRLIANGNNVLNEDSLRTQLMYQREYLRGDIGVAGTFWRRFTEHPIETALYGNVQLGFTPNAALTTPYLEIATESFFTKGQALPGISQAQ